EAIQGWILSWSASIAVYKQWIPNTNFENASNWDKDRIPCANDVVLFKSNQVFDFQNSIHLGQSLPYLPLTGEFIMAPGGGFAASDGSWDPAVLFTDAEKYKWHDPALWHAAASLEDLDQGKYIFAVDEERVPCQYDDVIFQPETSFRVNIDSSERMIHLRSISIMGQYGSLTAACSALCMSLTLVCTMAPGFQKGATISLEYTPGFDIRQYQNRILHAFLSLPKYAGVQMAISKVRKPQTSRNSVPVIQIVLMDDKMGSQTGTNAEQLAEDIMRDIAEHGNCSHSPMEDSFLFTSDWCSCAGINAVYSDGRAASTPAERSA
uniref:Protein amnionless n=1 Tax=Chelydra serpentina TaxID=8475 RepID=A0A8C3T020_CHESE